ncbi:GNAT family N-acetyltransferase [Gilvimarinus polysaccharolyticus]|uniref:GNAT family N-acetyltransferase n=1 Tax=Gilvimarinus polysaccharolyticus TaxID=863921 RepID=UPI00067379A1|nr:GNAT family N-acetyltransferase [Gilvimarinus polysaccharolyticus]
MRLEFISSIHAVSAAQWNALLSCDYPFARHEFLAALEDSQAVDGDSGWHSRHLLVYDDDTLTTALPGYIKTHSYGEYVFDWAWAEAYQRYGQHYYPKWIAAIPFTPCRGPRLLGNSSPERITALGHALSDYCQSEGLSGWHCLFPEQAVSDALTCNSAQRLGCQFHWFNRAYRSFDDFVATFASRKRKNVLKERRRVGEQGFSFSTLSGAELTPEHWQFFHQLYQHTYLKRSGHGGYLNAAFFQALGASLAEHCVMVLAHHDSQTVAAALYLRDNQTLYGRYWGCLEEFDFLHFETCYYQGIDYAIAQGITRFDGGAQGEHKIARGFEPVLTYSNHHLSDKRFADAVQSFVTEEGAMTRGYYKDAQAHLPYAQTEFTAALKPQPDLTPQPKDKD